MKKNEKERNNKKNLPNRGFFSLERLSKG